MAQSQPSGARPRATAVEPDVVPTERVYAGAPPRPKGVYELLVDGRLAGQAGATEGGTLTTGMASGTAQTCPGPVQTLRFTGLPDGEKDVETGLSFGLDARAGSANTP